MAFASALFSGSGIGTVLPVDFGSPVITVTFWAKWLSPQTNILLFESSTNYNNGSSSSSRFFVGTSGSGRFSASIKRTSYREESLDLQATNVWTHYAIVFDGSTLAADIVIYRNGVPVATAVGASSAGATQNSNFASLPVFVGARNLSTLTATGVIITDFAIYNIELSQQHITQLSKNRSASALMAAQIFFAPLVRSVVELRGGKSLSTGTPSYSEDSPALFR